MEGYNLTYLEHEIYQLPSSLGSFTLFVSPYSPIHLGGAFMLENMSEIWNDIPSVDILVTHTPPYGFGDQIIRNNRHVGCNYLKKKIDRVIKPQVCVFGHIHEAHGFSFGEDVLYVNACLSDHRYRAVNKPITFDLPIVSQEP
jgi:Icc-related predicted phosphoesterase